MSLDKVWYLNIDLETPMHVRDVVERMWEERDLGNDVYVIHTTIGCLTALKRDAERNAPLVAYLRENGVTEDELVLLRYAW
jgi:hypothetical protein